MSKLAVILFTVVIATIGVRCQAEQLDAESQLSQREDSDNLEGNDDSYRSASAQNYAPINTYNLPLPTYNPAKIKLVECYTCTDCPKVLSNTTARYCPYTNDHTKHNKCVVYSEKYQQLDKPWIIRGCASERGSCADITKAHENANAKLVKLLSCSECDGDKCNTNGVYRSLPTLSAAIFFVLMTPLIGKCALS
ncbi:uncharacterized protein LOC124639175 [Helicoverpa zea]|uniref:uncharacterized protein LOC124639175 n=1 Tax=Helicoverpa zea TaxID=7113 RepID=UPI001F582D5A|nr:uncharacterized protein LOC124639175 [Helicoverpa zea]